MFCPLTLDKILPPTRTNLLGRVSRSGEPGPVDESDLTWAELSEKMQQERLEHERLRRQDADVIRDLKMSEDMMIQLLDLRAKSFNSERCRLIEELNSVCVVHISREFSIHFGEISTVTVKKCSQLSRFFTVRCYA